VTEVDEDLEPVARPEHINAALMLSFGGVQPGREALAGDVYQEVYRFLGRVLAEGRIQRFKPYFFADGQLFDMIGFFLLEAHDRAELLALRQDEEFERLLAKAAAVTQTLRMSILNSGAAAGRVLNLHQTVREELGLVEGG